MYLYVRLLNTATQSSSERKLSLRVDEKCPKNHTPEECELLLTLFWKKCKSNTMRYFRSTDNKLYRALQNSNLLKNII